MTDERQSLKPVEGANRSLRRRLGLRGEFMLALFPTVTVQVGMQRAVLFMLARHQPR